MTLKLANYRNRTEVVRAENWSNNPYSCCLRLLNLVNSVEVLLNKRLSPGVGTNFKS